MKKQLLIFSGFILTLTGLLGIFLPLLPTTPFLILASICFSKSSPGFHQWLITHRLLGPPILEWKTYRMIRTKYKILATIMMITSNIIILLKPQIPDIGKFSFIIFTFCVLTYIWKQRGK